jgi:hypothetical protein
MASMQFMYVCMTCKKSDVCEICQNFGCHAGHDVYVKVTDLDEKRTQLKREYDALRISSRLFVILLFGLFLFLFLLF